MTAIAYPDRSASDTAPLTAAVVVGLAGGMVFVLAPLLLAALRRSDLSLTENQVGLIGSADPSGLFIGALLGFAAIFRLPRRKLAAGALCVVAATNLLGILMPQSFASLILLRLIAGTAGGLTLCVSYAGLSATRVPDRSYAIFIIAQTVTGAALFTGIGRWLPHADVNAVFTVALTLSIMGLVMAPWIHAGGGGFETARAPVRMPLRLTMLTIPSIGLIAAACLAVWANFPSFGEAAGIAPQSIALALSMGLAGGASGGLLVAFSARRFGRIVPCAILMALLIASGIALLFPLSAASLITIAFFFQFGISASNYIFGAVCEAAPGGSAAVIYLLSLKAGFAFGPWLGSRLIIFGGLDAVVMGFAATLAIVFMLFMMILVRDRADPLISSQDT